MEPVATWSNQPILVRLVSSDLREDREVASHLAFDLSLGARLPSLYLTIPAFDPVIAEDKSYSSYWEGGKQSPIVDLAPFRLNGFLGSKDLRGLRTR